ncbi:hypothetical protein ACIBQ6_00925 [Nonomuraea sp. NPDC049655]
MGRLVRRVASGEVTAARAVLLRNAVRGFGVEPVDGALKQRG